MLDPLKWITSISLKPAECHGNEPARKRIRAAQIHSKQYTQHIDFTIVNDIAPISPTFPPTSPTLLEVEVYGISWEAMQ